jgi:hypothetical protein
MAELEESVKAVVTELVKEVSGTDTTSTDKVVELLDGYEPEILVEFILPRLQPGNESLNETLEQLHRFHMDILSPTLPWWLILF